MSSDPEIEKITARRRSRWIAFALLLLPVLLVYAALWKQARSLPMQDDFLAIVNFGLVYKSQPSALARLMYVIAAQHNEYKLVVEHAIVAADLSLTGHLHFGLYIWIGNLLLLPIAWLFWSNLRPNDQNVTRRLVLFVPVCWLVFQLNYVENLDWAMCGLQTMPVVLFSLAALHFLVRSGRRALVLAFLFAVLGCLSSANGFLMGPVGVVLLLASRRVRQVVPWCAAYCVAAAVYLYRYKPFTPPHYQSGTAFSDKLLFFFSFAGAWAENMHHFPVRYGSVAAGCAVCAIVVFMAARTDFARSGAFYFYTLVWCLITAALAADKRVGEGLVVALSMRYKIYSDIALICLYAFAVMQFERWQASRSRGSRAGCCAPGGWPMGRCCWWCFALPAFLMCSAINFDCSPEVQRRGDGCVRGGPRSEYSRCKRSGDDYRRGEPDFSRRALVEALQTGLYRLPGMQGR